MGLSLGTAAVLGAGVSAYGQVQSSKANAAAQNYNAKIAENNAEISKQQATWAAEEGEQSAGAKSMETAAKVGAIKANQAASGVDVNSGSAVDVQNSAALLGKLDALTIRSNAARQAYGYQTQAVSEKEQSNLDKFAAKSGIEAGKINAGTTLLNGATKAGAYYDSYDAYQQKNSVLNTYA